MRDQRRALEELFRVIQPGGELRYYEHVRADTPGLARVQLAADRMGVSKLTGNEHFARRTGHGTRPPLPVRADGAGADLGLTI